MIDIGTMALWLTCFVCPLGVGPASQPSPTRSAAPAPRLAAPVPRQAAPPSPKASTPSKAKAAPTTRPSVGTTAAAKQKPQAPPPVHPSVRSPLQRGNISTQKQKPTGAFPYKQRKYLKKKLRSSLSNKTFFWTQVLGVVIALGLVIVLLYAMLRWLAQKMGHYRNEHRKMIYIYDRLPLEAKKSLWVVEVNGKHLLVASHEQGVSLLTELDPPKEEQEEEKLPATPVQSSFLQKLFLRPGAKFNEKKQELAKESERASEAKESSPIPTQFEVVSDGQDSPKT